MFNFGGIIFCFMIASAIESENAEPLPSALPAVGNSEFTTAIYRQIRWNRGNLFFSPLSLELALSLAYAGAGGKTATQIQKTLHLPKKIEKTVTFYEELMDKLRNDSTFTLNIANAIFTDKQFTVKEKFLDIVNYCFKAKVGQVDFRSPEETVNIINNFVSANTGNKITDLFNSSAFNQKTKLFLINAIYFKGDWELEFPMYCTEKRIFHLADGEEKEVEFMQIQTFLNVRLSRYLKGDIVEIPYRGGSLSLILAVPNFYNLGCLESKILITGLYNVTKYMRRREVILTMPKFKLEETIEFNEILIKMNITDLFDKSAANLSLISNHQSLFVSKVVQKAYFEVNERGAEAAADSGIIYTYENYSPPPLVLTLDYPFVFFVYHKATNTTLFMGRVSSP